MIRTNYLYPFAMFAFLFSVSSAMAEDIWDTASKISNIDKKTIQSICIHESGLRFTDGYKRAWPYTLNSRYGSMYFKTRSEAEAQLSKLISLNVTNIDIGMCQINMTYHKDKANPYQLLDPVVNVRVASIILRQLMYKYKGDIVSVVAAFHTGSVRNQEQLKRGQNYINSVAKLQSKL